MNSNKIYVAKLGKTVGLNGTVKIYIDSDFPEQFQKNAQFTTQRNQTLTVEKINPHNSTVKFIGIDSVEDAKKLTNKLLYTSIEDTKELCSLKENQYFWFDLIGCTIVENDEILGTVSDIQRLPLDDYFVIDTAAQLQEKNLPKQFLVPYNEQYILNVSIERKQITTINTKDILLAS
jgi:16S rRNA processing protein RimM